MIFTLGEATSRLLFRILNARGAAPRESMHSLGLRDVLVNGRRNEAGTKRVAYARTGETKEKREGRQK